MSSNTFYTYSGRKKEGHLKDRLKIEFFILQAYILIGIFYIFKSGYPQPGDIIILTGIGIMLIKSFYTPLNFEYNIKIFAILFAGYAFVVNIVNYIFMPDLRFLLSSAYYIFNVFVFIFAVTLAHQSPQKYKNIIYSGLAITILIQGTLAVIYPVMEGARLIGTFNNPNQLTYWGLISFALIIILKHNTRLNNLDITLIGIIGYLQLLALSKAGIIVFSLYAIALLFTNMVGAMQKFCASIFLIIFLIFCFFNFEIISYKLEKITLLNNVAERLSDIGVQSDDSFEGRGYDRIFDHPEYLILGAGEGGFSRFEGLNPKGNELHSGPATLFFSYGLVGVLFFGLFIYSVFKRLSLIIWIMLGGLVLYGLTHQSFRNTYFWLFLGTAHWVTIQRRYNKDQDAAHTIYYEELQPPSSSNSANPPNDAGQTHKV